MIFLPNPRLQLAVFSLWLLLLTAGCQFGPDLEKNLQTAGGLIAPVETSAPRGDDNARILYVAMLNDLAQIHSVQPNGLRGIPLTSEPGYKCRPTWNQAHTRIAYFRYPDNRPLGNLVSVVIMYPDGSNAKELLQHKKVDTQKTRICWNPDGSVLFFQELDFPSILFGYDAASGRQVETIRLPKNTFLQEAHSLSPNQRLIAGAGMARDGSGLHIGTIGLDGAQETDLMKPMSQNQSSYHLGTVVWSYDSVLVAFEMDNIVVVMSSAFRLDFRVYTVAPQDFDSRLAYPAFSPTGKKLACIMEKVKEGNTGSGDQEVTSDVWVMNVNGAEQKKITATGSCFDPHW